MNGYFQHVRFIVHGLLLMMLTLLPAACGSEEGSSDNASPGPYDITFSLDASFQGPHGDQPVSIALVRLTDRGVVAQGSGTVSAAENPSFSFSADAVMERGIGHAIHYWIDSNIGGGSLGVCDPKEIDHQWSVEFRNPTNDVDFTVSYNPSLTEDVCSTFN